MLKNAGKLKVDALTACSSTDQHLRVILSAKPLLCGSLGSMILAFHHRHTPAGEDLIYVPSDDFHSSQVSGAEFGFQEIRWRETGAVICMEVGEEKTV